MTTAPCSHGPGEGLRVRAPGTFAKRYSSQSWQQETTDVTPGSSLDDICQIVESTVGRQRHGKFRMDQHVRKVLTNHQHGLLYGCRLERVGSVSWNGDVPQSDTDMMLCTPQGNAEGPHAIALLEEFRRALAQHTDRKWTHLELLSTANVPILRARDSAGGCCDFSVDQWRAIRHRDFLVKALDGRPQVQKMLRLVKYWLRQRGLPTCSEGGLPSVAWVFAALSLADQQPAGTSLEVLLMHFFSEMHKIGTQFLDVRVGFAGSMHALWHDGWVSTWAEEWTELFRVADPTQPSNITPPSIPTALALLYVAELRLAWNAIRAKQWHKLWTKSPGEARMQLPSIVLDKSSCPHPPFHVVLKDGVVHAGMVHDTLPCPGLPPGEVLHRRDQSSKLQLQPCELAVVRRGAVGQIIVFQPCHWVCTLPLQDTDSLLRVVEIAQMVGIGRLNPSLQRLVATLKPNAGNCAPSPAICTSPAPICVWMPVSMVNATVGQNGDPENASVPHSTRPRFLTEAPRKRKKKPRELDYFANRRKPQSCDDGDLLHPLRANVSSDRKICQHDLLEIASEESTRASDTEDPPPAKGNENKFRVSAGVKNKKISQSAACAIIEDSTKEIDVTVDDEFLSQSTPVMHEPIHRARSSSSPPQVKLRPSPQVEHAESGKTTSDDGAASCSDVLILDPNSVPPESAPDSAETPKALHSGSDCLTFWQTEVEEVSTDASEQPHVQESEQSLNESSHQSVQNNAFEHSDEAVETHEIGADIHFNEYLCSSIVESALHQHEIVSADVEPCVAEHLEVVMNDNVVDHQQTETTDAVLFRTTARKRNSKKKRAKGQPSTGNPNQLKVKILEEAQVAASYHHTLGVCRAWWCSFAMGCCDRVYNLCGCNRRFTGALSGWHGQYSKALRVA